MQGVAGDDDQPGHLLRQVGEKWLEEGQAEMGSQWARRSSRLHQGPHEVDVPPEGIHGREVHGLDPVPGEEERRSGLSPPPGDELHDRAGAVGQAFPNLRRAQGAGSSRKGSGHSGLLQAHVPADVRQDHLFVEAPGPLALRKVEGLLHQAGPGHGREDRCHAQVRVRHILPHLEGIPLQTHCVESGTPLLQGVEGRLHEPGSLRDPVLQGQGFGIAHLGTIDPNRELARQKEAFQRLPGPGAIAPLQGKFRFMEEEGDVPIPHFGFPCGLPGLCQDPVPGLEVPSGQGQLQEARLGCEDAHGVPGSPVFRQGGLPDLSGRRPVPCGKGHGGPPAVEGGEAPLIALVLQEPLGPVQVVDPAHQVAQSHGDAREAHVGPGHGGEVPRRFPLRHRLQEISPGRAKVSRGE